MSTWLVDHEDFLQKLKRKAESLQAELQLHFGSMMEVDNMVLTPVDILKVARLNALRDTIAALEEAFVSPDTVVREGMD